MTHAHAASPEQEVVTAEVIAKSLAGIEQIGYARGVLEKAGYAAMIVANRIVVEGVEARLVFANGFGWWQVYATDGTPPVWTVGTTDHGSSSNWIGCVE